MPTLLLTCRQLRVRRENVWADYLMSYRVSANGSNKGLVKLDLERVTACVELYMARSEKVG